MENKNESTDDDIENTPIQDLPPQPAKRNHKRMWLWLLVVVLLCAGAGAAYWFWHKHKKTPATNSNTSTQTAAAKQLCFIRLGYLVCTDAAGNNRVRYNLPEVANGALQITSLSATSDQSTFVALATSTSNSPQTPAQVLLLDSKLAVKKQLTFPDNLTPGQPSISADGKLVALELTAKGNDRQIYSYDIASGKLAQLTSAGNNMLPKFINDGRIVYSSLADGSSSWMPYIMVADGSSKKALPGTAVAVTWFGFNYDESSNTLYLFGTTAGQSIILYGTPNNLSSGNSITTLHTDAIGSSADTVARLSADKLLVGKGNQGDGVIIDAATGKQTSTIAHYGTQVGWLNPAAFTRSTQQTEQAYERITGLATAPADFQTFIKQQFDQQDAACKGAPDGVQYMMIVNAVVRDSFANVGQSCGDGAVFYYAKVSDVWTKAFSTQSTPTCVQVNQYKFTKEILPQCYDTNSQLTANTNP